MKYVKLNKDRTEWLTPIFNVKPNPVRRHPDEILHTFDWYIVKESFAPITDRELYQHERGSWEVEEDSVYGHVVKVNYDSVLKDREQVCDVICKRVDVKRNTNMRGGLTYKGSRIATDEITLVRVTGLSVKAVIDPSISINFITVDNGIITLSASEVIELGNAFADFESQNVMTARILKDYILNHENPETVHIDEPLMNDGFPYDWPTGIYG